MKLIHTLFHLKRPGLTAALFFLAGLALPAAYVTWDASPTSANPGVQEASGNWGASALNTNWWNGAGNVSWVNANGDTAVLGVNTNTSYTVTVTNGVTVGGLVYSNAGTGLYTINNANSAILTFSGGSPFIQQSDTNIGTHLITLPVVATGGLTVTTTHTNIGPASINVRFNSTTTNYITSFNAGTAGNASYTASNALYVDFNSANSSAALNNLVVGMTNLTIFSNATVRLSGANVAYTLSPYPQTVTISGDGQAGMGGAWVISGNLGGSYAANVVLAGSSTIDLNAGAANQTYTLNGVISGTGDLRIVSANSAANRNFLTITNACTYVGNTTIAGGSKLTLINGNDRLPTATVLTLGATTCLNSLWNSSGVLVLGNSTLAVNQTVAGLKTDASTLGCAVLGGNSSTASVLTVNNGTDNTFIGSLGGAAAPANKLALVKNGAGNLFLQVSNLCAGGYTVNNGSIQFGDGVTDYPFSGPVTNNAAVVFNVASALTDASLITGSGSVTKQGNGTLTLSASNLIGSLIVSAGTVNCTATQTVGGVISLTSGVELDLKRPAATNFTAAGSLNCNANTLKFDFNNKGMAPAAPLKVAGAFTNAGQLTIYINNVNPGSVAVGTYTLIKYGNFVDAGSSSFALGAAINAQTTAYVTNNTVNNSIDLVVTDSDYLLWTGATDTNWDFTTSNWQLHSTLSPTTYADGGFVLFNDSASQTNVNLTITPSPSVIIVTNDTKSYLFGGANGISGAAALYKQGNGSLTLTNGNNSYTGGTTISGGSLILGDGTTDTSLASPIQDDAALVIKVAFGNTPPAISGAGSVTVNNSGTLNLSTANSYTGATTVNGGIVQMGNSAAFGTTNSGTVLSVGTELDITANVNAAEPLTLGGTGGVGGGALVLQPSTGNSTLTGALTATANTTLVAPFGTSLTLGVVNGGNNTLTFLPANTAYFTVSSNLSAGSLLLHEAGGLFLTAANDTVTNIVVDKANPTTGSISATAGITAYNSHALGTNSSVTVSNSNLIGNSGAIFRLGNNANIPSGVSLNIVVPGNGDGGAGQYRATFGTLGAGTTNIWNGPITVHGADPVDNITSLSIIRPDSSSQLIINGNVTLADGEATLFVRGGGQTIINGQVNWGTNIVSQTADGVSDLYINATGNTWREFDFAGASSRLHVGANNALPIAAPILIVNTSDQVDLNGFNQQIGGLYSTAAGTVVNNSTNTVSTLTVASTGGSNWVYTGTIANAGGATKALNLTVGGDTLTLTASGNNYTGSTVISNGAVLALSGSGNISASTPMIVKAGGTFDVGETTSGSFTLTANRTLMGNGTVNGSLATASGSVLSPGESIGALTVTTNLTISGNLLFEVNKALSPAASNDVITVDGVLTNTSAGTLTVSNLNLAAPLALGDRFVLFNKALTNGSAMTIAPIPGFGLAWSNNLAVDGSISVVQGPATNPTNITFSVSGSSLTLTWPADHLGWHLQQQTNSLTVGLNTNWITVPGSDLMTTTNITINPAKPTVFYRLVYP